MSQQQYNTEDLGYGDTKPELSADKYGYGDAQPDSSGAVDYGYGDAQPDNVDYGYGDAKPDPSTVDYGYGDAKPDDADKYGYGDAKPDEAVDYGYGDAKPDDAEKYGYGDNNDTAEYSVGLNDDDGSSKKTLRRRAPGRTASNESMASVATADSYGEYDDGFQRKQRYRRRGSVTKYSIEATQEVAAVQEEHNAHANIIDQFRNQCAVGGGDAVTSDDHVDIDIPPAATADTYIHKDMPAVVGSMTPHAGAGTKNAEQVTISPLQPDKKKKKNRFKNLRRRFSIR